MVVVQREDGTLDVLNNFIHHWPSHLMPSFMVDEVVQINVVEGNIHVVRVARFRAHHERRGKRAGAIFQIVLKADGRRRLELLVVGGGDGGAICGNPVGVSRDEQEMKSSSDFVYL